MFRSVGFLGKTNDENWKIVDSDLTKSQIPWARWIGEFIVIALGVAIGFQVDRWYEQRQDNDTAAQYILRLKEDISRDVDNSNGSLAGATSRMERLQRVVQSVQSDAIVLENPTRYMFDIRQGLMRFLPVASDSTYRELESTGNMALLSIELRKALHEYYSEFEKYGQFYGAYEAMQMEAYRRFAGILPAENFGVLSGVFDSGEITYSVDEALTAANKLRSNRPAQDWLYQMGELKAQEIDLSKRFQEGAQTILTLLEGL